MKFVFEQKRAFADSEVLDGVDCICPLCACWEMVKSCDGDWESAMARGGKRMSELKKARSVGVVISMLMVRP